MPHFISRNSEQHPPVESPWRPRVLLALFVALLSTTTNAWAGDASKHAVVFVPPNNLDSGASSTLTITAQVDNTNVTVTDDDADGDDDDSTTASLDKGESLIVRISDGLVDDDASGIADGDALIIDSNKPVVTMLSTKSQRNHDWVPSVRRNTIGEEFYVWAHDDDWDIDIVAYEDETIVNIYDITETAKLDSGTTSLAAEPELLVSQQLNQGEDLLNFLYRSGTNLTKAGHTYWIVTSNPTACMFGAFYGNERDGGGYVPSETGTAMGTHFYFPVPAGLYMSHEREVRIAAGADSAQVTIRGWAISTGWRDIGTYNILPYGHLDITGIDNTICNESTFFEVEATENINIFEGNWIESGATTSSDFYTFVSSLDGSGKQDMGREFITYVGPPGDETNSVLADNFSHLYIVSPRDNTQVTITDVDTGGTLFNRVVDLVDRDVITDVQISQAEYDAMNASNRPYLHLSATRAITVGATNWSDDWLAFPSSGDTVDLGMRITGPEVALCDQEIDLTVRVINRSDGPITGITFTQSAVGEFTLTGTPVDPGTLALGAHHEQTLTGIVACSDVATGDLVGMRGIAQGTNLDGDTVTARRTESIPAYVPDVVGVLRVTAAPDACAVEVRWLTDEDDGSSEFVVKRRVFDSGDPLVEIGRVASLAQASSGFEYGYRDTSAAQGINYQYVVEAVEPGTTNTISFSGPAVCDAGAPFTDAPATTGNLANDYIDIGQVVADPVADVEVLGMDVDDIAVAYDRYTDSLYLAVSAAGVFGDMDGDGDPDTNTLLGSTGITDQANFGEDEQFAFVLDFDQDGVGDAVVGIPFGGNLDLLQATSANQSLIGTSPTLAFLPQTAAQSGTLLTTIINEPTAGKPDLELVVRNASALNNDELLEDIGLSFYMHASSATNDIEWAPSQSLSNVDQADAVTASCGVPAEQIHLGAFAAFGNVFTGSPRFEFVPFGWEDTESGEVYHAAPEAVPGSVITSPTLALPDRDIDVQGVLNLNNLNLSEQKTQIQESSGIAGDDFKLTLTFDWNFAAAEGDDRYENIDIQAYRLVVTDCTTTVFSKQTGVAGGLLNERYIRLADDSIAAIQNVNPANTLAASVIGTFETEGAISNLFPHIPEDWVSDFGPSTAPEFTHYAFLDDLNYLAEPTDTFVEPFGATGVELPPGMWFINYYLWSYANNGTSVIETTFVPGPDCEGTL